MQLRGIVQLFGVYALLSKDVLYCTQSAYNDIIGLAFIELVNFLEENAFDSHFHKPHIRGEEVDVTGHIVSRLDESSHDVPSAIMGVYAMKEECGTQKRLSVNENG